MNINIVRDDKNEVEMTMDRSTIAEILRVYLNENGADFAAWRREHPSKPVLLKISAQEKVSKVIGNAVDAIKKDCDKLLNYLKK